MRLAPAIFETSRSTSRGNLRFHQINARRTTSPAVPRESRSSHVDQDSDEEKVCATVRCRRIGSESQERRSEGDDAHGVRAFCGCDKREANGEKASGRAEEESEQGCGGEIALN
jgi:hypothetical protein